MAIQQQQLNDLEWFIKYLIEEERSDNTIEKYRRDVLRFLEFIQEQEVEKKIVLSYKELLKGTYSPSSVNSMLAAVNKYLDFIGLSVAKVKPLKLQKEIFLSSDKELTIKDYKKLVETAEKQGNEKLAMLLQTICSTGIRVSELPFVTTEAVNVGMMKVFCKGKSRTVFLPKELCSQLRKYCRKNDIKNGVIFRTKTGKSLDRSNIWKMMKSLCKLAGVLETKVFPHNLRHLFARTYYKIEKDISKLADILGHSNINTTRIYIMESVTVHAQKMSRMRMPFLLKRTT